MLGRLSSLELLQGLLAGDLLRCSGGRLGLLSFLGFSARFLSIDSISVLTGLSSGVFELFIFERLFVHELCVLGLIDDSLYVCLQSTDLILAKTKVFLLKFMGYHVLEYLTGLVDLQDSFMN